MKRIGFAVTGLVLLSIAGCGGSNSAGTGSGAVGTPAAVGADSTKDDAKKLQGTWAALEVLHDGQVQKLDPITWTFADDKYTNKVGKQTEKWTYKLDGSKNPKTIDSEYFVSAGFPGRKLTGIYELNGDTLKVCYDLTGKGHPNDFTAAKGARRIFYTFKRE